MGPEIIKQLLDALNRAIQRPEPLKPPQDITGARG